MLVAFVLHFLPKIFLLKILVYRLTAFPASFHIKTKLNTNIYVPWVKNNIFPVLKLEKITLPSAIYFSFPFSAQNIYDIFGFWVKFDARDGADVESIHSTVVRVDT